MTSCLKAATMYEDTCKESFQCSNYLFSGGMCTNERCICAPGYHYLHGRCYKTAGKSETLPICIIIVHQVFYIVALVIGLKNTCLEDVDCVVNGDFEAIECKGADGQRFCECKPGFYQREYRTCRRFANGLRSVSNNFFYKFLLLLDEQTYVRISETFNECAINLDCHQFNEKAICGKDFTCVLQDDNQPPQPPEKPEPGPKPKMERAGSQSGILAPLHNKNQKLLIIKKALQLIYSDTGGSKLQL